MAWRALVTNSVTAVMEAGSPSCRYDAMSLVVPFRDWTAKSASVLLMVATSPPLFTSPRISDNLVSAWSSSRRPREPSGLAVRFDADFRRDAAAAEQAGTFDQFVDGHDYYQDVINNMDY